MPPNDHGYDQPSLLDATDIEPGMWDRFCRWRDQNPAAMEAMMTLARRYRDQFGRRRIGVNMLVEVARWHVAFTSNDPEYKIDNNLAPFISRELVVRDPSLAPLFRFKPSKADRHFGVVFHPSGVRLDRGPGAE